MERKVLAYIEEQNMIPRNSTGILAVSGGADSMCLLHILHRLSTKMHLSLTVCHVIHGIRGAEAEEDAAFVERTAKELGLACRIYRRDVPAVAAKQGLSLEEAGRNVRYACFRELKKELKADWIALAHQRDDQAETVLFRILRGTGLRGLRGILPVQGDCIRPLLSVSRAEIEAWMQAQGLPWRTDSTNLDSDYTRNLLRNQVLPELCREYPGMQEHLLLLAKEAEELYDIQEAEVERLRSCCRYVGADGTVGDYESWTSSGNLLSEIRIPAEAFWCASGMSQVAEQEEDPKLQRQSAQNAAEQLLEDPGWSAEGELLLQELERLTGRRKDITRKHILAVQELLQKETGKRVDLPYGIFAERTYEGLRLAATSDRTGRNLSSGHGDSGGDRTATKGKTLRLKITRRPYISGEEIPVGETRKLVDADCVKDEPRLRTMEPGDRIMIDGSGSTKPLARFFTDRKIPREQRADWPVVADAEKILWVVGLRLSEACKVTEKTKEVYLLEIGE